MECENLPDCRHTTQPAPFHENGFTLPDLMLCTFGASHTGGERGPSVILFDM